MHFLKWVSAAALLFACTLIDAAPPANWEFTGMTQPSAVVEARAMASGCLMKMLAREGDAVAKGDVLAEIDPRLYRLNLDAAKAQLTLAEAKLEAARIKADNTKRLKENKVVSPDEVALSSTSVDEAEAAMTVAKLDVARAELKLSWTKMTAPFAGRVSRIRVPEGSLVSAEQTPILTVVALDPLSITFDVPEDTALHLHREGLAKPDKLDVAVEFASDKDDPVAAKLEFVDFAVDSNTGKVHCRATFPNPDGRFMPGMSARIRLTLRQSK